MEAVECLVDKTANLSILETQHVAMAPFGSNSLVTQRYKHHKFAFVVLFIFFHADLRPTLFLIRCEFASRQCVGVDLARFNVIDGSS